MAGEDGSSANQVGQRPHVQISKQTLNGIPKRVNIPAVTISIYRFETAR
jgi:hypothetical protein